MKKINLIVMIIIIFIVILCVQKNSEKTEKKNSLDRILDKKTFILGLDDSFPPMGFRNEENEIVGFDIDVAKEVCKRLDVELIIQPISWTAKEQELESYNIDCIWNGMSVTEDRKEKMCLSNSYLENKMSFVTKNEYQINSLDDLKEKKIGVQAGSSAEEILKSSDLYSNFKEVITYSDNLTAFMDLDINQIDSVFLDDVVANYYINENNKQYKVLEQGLEKEEYAIGFRKEDIELCEKVNEILLEMKNDGLLEKISEKWFGKDITIIK